MDTRIKFLYLSEPDMIKAEKCRRPPVYGDAGISWRKIPDGRNEVVWK